jgi:thiamine pyrophosphokinase
MKAAVVGNGALPDLGSARRLARAADLVIAADGGARHCRTLGVCPAVVVGDLDSAEDETVRAFACSGTAVIRHSPRKDATDLELAVRIARERGAHEAVVLAGLGDRWDHSLANLLLTAADDLRPLRLWFRHGPDELRLVRPGEELELAGAAGEIVSLVPLAGDALGVTSEGLDYPLRDDILRFGIPRGISNVMSTARARVRLDRGLLLCVHRRGE